MGNKQNDSSMIVDPENGLASSLSILLTSSFMENKDKPGKVYMYLKDFSFFHESSLMDLVNKQIQTMSDKLLFEIVVDNDPSVTIKDTAFETLLREKPDHVTIKRLYVSPGVVHFIINRQQSITEMSWSDNSWIFSMDDTEACDLMRLNHMALMNEADNNDGHKIHDVIKYDTRTFVEENYTDTIDDYKTRIIVTDNYVELGKLTALRFLEWVYRNPEGVISLPTGKTPEFFIAWTEHYLKHWDEYKDEMRLNHGIDDKPAMNKLTFFQMDEYVPMNPNHPKSFNRFVREQYVKRFGLNPDNVHLIDTSKITKKNIDRIVRDYEYLIRTHGGIGFFLGGIGPDGHIAFNISGSAKDSMTRIVTPNKPTLAGAAEDLGGITKASEKELFTIGLDTITMRPDCTVIIMAAGDQKSIVVKKSVEQEKFNRQYPASILNEIEHGRFYVTKSVVDNWDTEGKTMGFEIVHDLKRYDGLKVLHTSPHHDDMELGYHPLAVRLLEHCENRFVYLTEGYTSVTDEHLMKVLSPILVWNLGLDVNMDYDRQLSDYNETLSATGGLYETLTPLAHRIITKIQENRLLRRNESMSSYITHIYRFLGHLESGVQRDFEDIKKMKSWIREFEAESQWYSHGVSKKNVQHLRLPFYSDETFPRYPDFKDDVLPILELLNQERPDIVTVALDPEGSGPGTHFKCLLAMYKAIEMWKEADTYGNPNFQIWGYRNVWSKFTPNNGHLLAFPTTHSDVMGLETSFNRHFKSQVDAEFPNPYYENAPFDKIATSTWREQWLKNMDDDSSPQYGLIFVKPMTMAQFKAYMEPFVKAIEDSPKAN